MAFFQAETLWVNELPDGRAVVVLDVPGSKTNEVGRRVVRDLHQALEAIEERGTFRLLILRSGKADHFATGPGLEEWAALRSAQDFRDFAEAGQKLCARLEKSSLVSVAVISGACRGPGLELALACDYRVVPEKAAAVFALVEEELGLMPAWGGGQRVLRLIGLARTLNLVLSRVSLAPEPALKYGLIDVFSEHEGAEAAEAMSGVGKRALASLPYRGLKQRLVESHRLGRWLLFRGADAWLAKHGVEGLPAAAALLKALRRGVQEGFEAGLAEERAALAELGQGDAFLHLLALQQQKQEELGRWADVARPSKVGVVGAGLRGINLVHLLVSEGFEVTIREIDETTLGLAMFRLLSLFQQEVQRGLMNVGRVRELLAHVHGTSAWKGFGDVGLALEAISPDVEKLQSMLKALAEQIDGAVPVAVTSLRAGVRELQTGKSHPERLVGLHFLPRAPVAEIVASEPPAAGAIERVAATLAGMNRLPLVVADSPGFAVHRVLLAGVLEAVLLLKEGWLPRVVDDSLRSFGWMLGPLEWADLLGIDSAGDLIETLGNVWSDRFPADNVFAYFVSKGWLGQKAQRGFYRYHRGRARQQRFLVEFLRERGRQEGMYPGPTLSMRDQQEQARERIIAVTMNEACWCLEEGVVPEAEQFNLALALSGWAPHRGGPLIYAKEQGRDAFVERLHRLVEEHGRRFQPCPVLEKHAYFS